MENNQTNKTVNMFAIGLTGVLLGVAATTAVALSDEEVRKRANQRAKGMILLLSKWGKQSIKNLQEKKELLSKTADDTLPAGENL